MGYWRYHQARPSPRIPPVYQDSDDTQQQKNQEHQEMTDHGHSGGRRTYVLDTNVLLYDPNAIFKFEEHDVLIPITVIEEIDRFKKDLTETGRNARQFSRFLDELRDGGASDLKDGVQLPDGGISVWTSVKTPPSTGTGQTRPTEPTI
jgi:hypothetical protein